MAQSSFLKCCALLFVALLLAGGGILAWQLLAGDDNDKEGGGGLFDFDFFDEKNETATAAPINDSVAGRSPAPTTMPPTASPSALPSLYRYPFSQCADDATACCNGLENLCDWPVNEILFGGVHNAQATTDKFLVPNHQRPVDEALEAGYRAINFDVCLCQGVWQLCHGLCGLGSADPEEIFTQLATFLQENENEVVVLTLELNSEAGQTVDLNDFYADILVPIEGFSDLLYFHESPDDPWPTLGTLIENDERLIAFHLNGPECSSEGDCPRGMHWYFQYAQETEFGFETIEELLDADNSCLIGRGATTTTGAFLGVNNFVTSNDLNLDNQLLDAEAINALDFANQRLQRCEEVIQAENYRGNGDINFLFIDFWSVGDIVQVVQEYNQNLGEKN